MPLIGDTIRSSLLVLVVVCGCSVGAEAAARTASGALFRHPIIVRPAFDAVRVPDWAVDHVAVKEVVPLGGPKRTERVVHTRSGHRYKEQLIEPAGRSPSFTDLRTRTHVTFARHEDGRYRHVGIDRPEPRGDYYTYRRQKTGERDQLLGEDCDVWSTRRVSSREDDLETDWLTCLTADGIELWTKIKWPGRGKMLPETRDYSRTISFERRKVQLSEVLPPTDLLDRSKWAGMSSDGLGPDPVVNHEVRLEGGHYDEPEISAKVRVVREQAPWSFRLDLRHNGERHWWIVNRASGWMLRARRLPDGSLHSLSTSSFNRAIPREKMVKTGKTKVIAGESCDLVRQAAPGPHDDIEECHSADGIILSHNSTDTRYGGGDMLTAVAVRRAKLKASELLPPPIFFDPGQWKIWPARKTRPRAR